MKILISWIALTNDFAENSVNTIGPNYFFHKFHYNHDKHILLYTSNTETKAIYLQNKLSVDFPAHLIETRAVNISDISDLMVVKSKVESILLEYADNEIDIFFSPGASMMQLSWYICHNSLGLKTNLVQLLRKEHSKSKDKPDLVQIESSFSGIPRTAILKQTIIGKPKNLDFLITESIKPIYENADKIAQTDNVTVLITGETGTGKEHLAKYIHENSARKQKPFEAVNCAGFSDELLESRLFGHKKGSFTGALNSEIGIFKKADGGTVFLDEIGDITPYMQQSLLRVLQEKEIRPIGGDTVKIDVRIISATNKNLLTSVTEGKFRSDLFYRLAVTDLHLPSLQERGSADKNLLLNFFITQKKIKLKKNNEIILSENLKKFINTYTFPGNIRELENLIERLYVFCDRNADITNLSAAFMKQAESKNLSLDVAERKHIEFVLEKTDNNKSEAAKILGIALNTLKSKLKNYEDENFMIF